MGGRCARVQSWVYLDITKCQRTGNPQRKLPEDSIQAMMDYIENDYETDRLLPIVHSHGQMVKYCKSKGIHPPSYKTYCKEIKKRRGYKQTLKHKGHRAAYQEKVPYLYLDQDTPRHGNSPGRSSISIISRRMCNWLVRGLEKYSVNHGQQ